jgi:alkanesulfonate monooxygenase SsuD/methylene tetrahydromethanopterin reductase-like flavin-dependent oxidoreductase (luciferase family)
LYLVTPIVAETDREAQERARHWSSLTERDITWHLALASKVSGIDWGSFDLDEPLPDVLAMRKNGVWQDTPAPPKRYNPDGSEMTFRQTIEAKGGGHWRGANSLPFVGTPDSVAAMMAEAMQEIGGDGFLIQNLYLTRRYVAEICDGLIPALQRRGLIRDHYSHTQFRDNLYEY